MLESLNTELNEKNSALETRVLQLERQVIFAYTKKLQCDIVSVRQFFTIPLLRFARKNWRRTLFTTVPTCQGWSDCNAIACNLTRPDGHKVSILLGDREQHMLTILNGFKATNEQVGYRNFRCLLVRPLF